MERFETGGTQTLMFIFPSINNSSLLSPFSFAANLFYFVKVYSCGAGDVDSLSELLTIIVSEIERFDSNSVTNLFF